MTKATLIYEVAHRGPIAECFSLKITTKYMVVGVMLTCALKGKSAPCALQCFQHHYHSTPNPPDLYTCLNQEF